MTAPVRTQQLPARSEYRFELEPGERISLRLVPQTGDAEVFGAELLPGADKWYAFGDEAKVAVTTWSGSSTEYLSDEPSPTYTSYANLHLHLEQARLKARAALRADPTLITQFADAAALAPTAPAPALDEDTSNGVASTPQPVQSTPSTLYNAQGQGPRIIIVGPEAAGKTSLVKMLANYALRSPAVCNVPGAAVAGKPKAAEASAAPKVEQSEETGWWPTVVNLDPSAGTAPLPCTLSLLPLSPIPYAALASSTPALPLGTTGPTTGLLPTGPGAAHSTSPLALWLGREDARANEQHAKRVVDWLADALEKRLSRDARARCSGVIVDTMGVTTADGRGRYAFLQHAVRAFKIDTIVVLGHEKLNIEMSKLFGGQGSGIRVIKLPKSGGAIELDETYRARLRALQIRSYFYGGQLPSTTPAAPTSSAAESLAPASADDPSRSGAGAQSGAGSLALPPGHAENPLGGLPALSPLTTMINLDLLEIYRVGQESMAPSSALPIGMGRTVTSTQLVKLDPLNSAADQAALLHSVLALVEPPHGGGLKGKRDSETEPPPSDDEILGATVLGFVHVANIDVARKKMTILSPNPSRRLPSKTALLGTLDWQDS